MNLNPYKSPDNEDEYHCETARAAAIRGAKIGAILGGFPFATLGAIQLGIWCYFRIIDPSYLPYAFPNQTVTGVLLESGKFVLEMLIIGACGGAAFCAARARGRRIKAATRKNNTNQGTFDAP